MRIAVAQMTTTSNADHNLGRIHALTQEASREGADLVVFPEMAYFRGKLAECIKERDRFTERMELFSSWAKDLNITLIPGSLREPASDNRWFNTLPVFGRDGATLALYRKIFLFRAQLPGENYDEPRTCEPGRETVTVEVEGWTLGLTICYDLRFPECFRRLLHQGAEAFVCPASFTVPTGKAHWDLLTRCRAMENLVPLAAPGQGGTGGDGLAAYGHSRLISPWGEVESELSEGEGLLYADWDRAQTTQARKKLDVWSSKRPDLFPP